MKKIITIGSLLLLILAGCSSIPSRTQVEKRKFHEGLLEGNSQEQLEDGYAERLEDAVWERERDLDRLVGTSNDDPTPRIREKDRGRTIKKIGREKKRRERAREKEMDRIELESIEIERIELD